METSRSFEERIEAALLNGTLRLALGRNAERRVHGRDEAFAALPEAEAVRDQGRAIRLQTIAHLGEYLEQFAANAEQNGMRLHWAADAAEARAIVLSLTRQALGDKPDGVVAKSKSMVSEEIGLNQALEAAGIRAVETDLGEFIVQLRGEPPAHIITPAVHLRREDVSDLFHRHFGMPPTQDVAAMTAVARAQLRQTFFSADVGLSGVNFAVAETGTLALVTNEGNGRMCTTLPRVHIALLGLERLAPTLADLEIMLRLLPRSATSQKLTSYVSLINGPRRPGEPDGPSEVHVVIIDNGRSRLLAGEMAEALLCIRCGACLNVCPVFRQIGGHAYGSAYPGPIGALISPALIGPQHGQLANASTLCGACRDVCPVRIDIPRMLLAVRAQEAQAGRAPAWLKFGLRLWAWGMASPARYRLGQWLAAWGARLLARGGRVRWLPGPLAAWTRRRDFPVFAGRTFAERWRRRRAGVRDGGR